MKINGKSQELVKLLSKVSTVCSTSKEKPVLAGILLTVSDDKLVTVASDGQTFVKAELKGSKTIHVEEPGSVIVQKGLIKFLEKAGESFELSLEASCLVFKGKGTKLEFPILDPSDFPSLPGSEQTQGFTLKSEQFSTLLNKTIVCAAQAETRPVLTGINISSTGTQLAFSATDSHQFCRCELDHELQEDLNVTVPAKSLKDIASTFNSDIKFFCSGQLFVAKDQTTTFYTRVLEGNYPNTTSFVNLILENTSIVRLNRKEVLNALKNIEFLLKEEGELKTPVKFVANEEVMVLSAAPGKSSLTLEVPVSEMLGEGVVEFYFSIKLLLNLISTMEGEEVQIGFDDPLKPVAVLPDELNGEYRMLSPVRAGA
ncbi:DNA polymerase III subunit beta (plasmid) [Alkalihalophilus sp. As8PL]|uniref:DNA polymerase III subunit beta n=1 Tax=Alkalihalophilus sp. As8PL TaxID=3237103 RepID=A0AB39BNQ3_9BACI